MQHLPVSCRPIIIIIIHEFHGDTTLETKLQGPSKCHILGRLASVNAAVAGSVRCRTICETVVFNARLTVMIMEGFIYGNQHGPWTTIYIVRQHQGVTRLD